MKAPPSGDGVNHGHDHPKKEGRRRSQWGMKRTAQKEQRAFEGNPMYRSQRREKFKKKRIDPELWALNLKEKNQNTCSLCTFVPKFNKNC